MKWVEASVRLPTEKEIAKNNGKFLIYGRSILDMGAGQKLHVCEAYFNGNKEWGVGYYSYPYFVSHWMNLPNAPKVKDNLETESEEL